MTLTLALDIGGTKIAAGLVDAEGRLVHRAQLPTPDGDAETVWAVVEKLLGETMQTADGAATGVGVASAGPIDLPNGTVSPINIAEWQHFPIVDRVTDTTRLPVRLGGDGLCMALGEQWCGAGRGAQFLLGMVVSTGVGGGLVLDGAPYDGRTATPGTSAMSSSPPTAVTRVRVAGMAASRPSRPGPAWCGGPARRGGPAPTPRCWVRQQLKEMGWPSRHFIEARGQWRR